jgi:hypothetical protein
MGVDRHELSEKLRWIRDNYDSLDSPWKVRLDEEAARLADESPDGVVNINTLSEDDAEQLLVFCEWIARDSGWGWVVTEEEPPGEG